jgi:hypothetical protein
MNNMEIAEHTWQEEVYVTRETSFGIQDQTPTPITCEFTIGIRSDDTGWFEWYDVESGGVEYYCEGGLWFDGMNLTDYDGVFDLSHVIKEKLIQLGYNLDEI